jgi:hypothetical protein
MDYEELKKLNIEFAEQTNEMTQEFVGIFRKWMKKNPSLTIVNSIHLPLNILINLIDTADDLGSKALPELPDVFKRFLMPFIILKTSWGKIPDKKFIKEYERIYQSQFGEFFPEEELKELFKKWIERSPISESEKLTQ